MQFPTNIPSVTIWEKTVVDRAAAYIRHETGAAYWQDNRGQTQGAVGNFTMFHFSGDNISILNITLGNYCNVDLTYPLNPKLNRKKRNDAIVQAQLAICNGDTSTSP